MYGLHNKLQAKEKKGQELANILLEASKIVAKAKGCKLYMISQDESNQDCLWVTEVWDSKIDHDESLKITEVRNLISKAMPLLSGMPEQGQKLTVFGGHGIKL